MSEEAGPSIAALVQKHSRALDRLSLGLEDQDEGLYQRGALSLVGAVLGEIPFIGGFAEAGVEEAWSRSSYTRMNAALKQQATEDARALFLKEIGGVVEELMAQAVIQIIRANTNQHEEQIEALGGERRELRVFREDFAGRADLAKVEVLDAAAGGDGAKARIELMTVRDGGSGIVFDWGAMGFVTVDHLAVSGEGSVGIHLKRK